MAFSMPPDWADDQRMNFLFQPFKLREANPLSYDAKLSFWKELICRFLQFEAETNSENPRLTVTIDDLQRMFKRNGKTPQCLAIVIESLLRNGALVLANDMHRRLHEQVSRKKAGWASWSYQVMVGLPLRMAADKVQSMIVKKPQGSDIVYAIADNVKHWALQLISRVWTQSSSSDGSTDSTSGLVLSKEEVFQLFKRVDSHDVELLLLWLEAENLVVSIKSDDAQIYKFAHSKSSKAEHPTEVELGIWRLKKSRFYIAGLLENFQREINTLNSSIRQHVREKNKQHALMLLKKRKNLEKKYDVNSKHLLQLDDVLDEIYHSETSHMVLQAYQSGTKALKSLHTPMTVRQAHGTMDELHDAVEISKEVTDVISSSGLTDVLTDDEDLERELNELLDDNKESSTSNIDDLLLHLDSLKVNDTPLATEVNKSVEKCEEKSKAMHDYVC